jgi:hypothetical protein
MWEEKKIGSHKKSKHTRKIKRIRTHYIFYKFINKTIFNASGESYRPKMNNKRNIRPGYYNIFVTHLKKKIITSPVNTLTVL